MALCITEELWALSGVDSGNGNGGVSGLVASLAKVLSSLPLPEDDQVKGEGAQSGEEGMEELALDPRAQSHNSADRPS